MMPSAASFPKQTFHEYTISSDMKSSNTELINKGNKISFSIDSLVGLQNTNKLIEKANLTNQEINKNKLYSKTPPRSPTPNKQQTNTINNQEITTVTTNSTSLSSSEITNTSSPLNNTRISSSSSVKNSPSPVISNGPPFSSTISQPITPTPISPSLMNLRVNQMENQHNHSSFVAAAAAAAALNPQFGLFGASPNIRTPFDYHQAASFYPWFMARQSPFVSNSFHGGHFNSPISPFLLPPYRKPKRIRTAFSPNQLLKLEQAFEKNHYVVGAERKQLAQGLNLTETQVKVWFQNRRTKHKRQKQEDEEKSDSTGSNNKNDKGSPSHHQSDDEEEIDEDESDIDPDSLDTDCMNGARNLFYHHPHLHHHHHFNREES